MYLDVSTVFAVLDSRRYGVPGDDVSRLAKPIPYWLTLLALLWLALGASLPLWNPLLRS